MKSLGNFPDPFIAEIGGQPDALRRAAAGLASAPDRLASLGPAGGRSIVFTGMGSSYHACYPAVTELARAGVPTVMVDASELLHFRMGMLTPSTVLIAVSQSGESAEVVRISELVERSPVPPHVVAVTNNPTSSLAHAADQVFETNAGPETGPSTMTFAASLVVVAALGRTLTSAAARSIVGEIVTQAELAAVAMERILADGELPEVLSTWIEGRQTPVILGRGPARAAAEMGALTIKEAVGMQIESLQTAQFRHGPLELVGPSMAAMVIATEPETVALDLQLAEELHDAGAASFMITERDEGPAGIPRLAIGHLDRALAPAVSILPAQLLAWRLSVLRGREPGAYVRASKVTVRE